MAHTLMSRHKELIDQEGKALLLEYDLLGKEITVEGKRVEVYGIGIRADGEAGETVQDISSDAQAVGRLLEFLWEMDVTPVTLKDIIRDYIEN